MAVSPVGTTGMTGAGQSMFPHERAGLAVNTGENWDICASEVGEKPSENVDVLLAMSRDDAPGRDTPLKSLEYGTKFWWQLSVEGARKWLWPTAENISASIGKS
jgi:hypothetical protein